MDIQRHSVHTLVFRSLKRSHDMFLSDQGNPPIVPESSLQLKYKYKAALEYKDVLQPVKEAKRMKSSSQFALPSSASIASSYHRASGDRFPLMITGPQTDNESSRLDESGGRPVDSTHSQIFSETARHEQDALMSHSSDNVKSLLPRKAIMSVKPNWHPPWKLYRVISGHTGWVRCIDVEPGNEWFATGANDRIIKIWDLASGKLKLSLTGHVSAVRAVKVSQRQPYLFSAGEDKQVKCWDLEYNKVVRHYHGHLSAVYDLALHPTIDILFTCGRDSTVRVWDMRTKANIHTLTGHTNTVACVLSQEAEPQVLSGSHDSTIRLWDLAAGKTRATLTNHKKSIRAMCLHPTLYMFASASPDNIKQWKCPEGKFLQNVSGHNAIINALTVNQDGVMISGGDNGSLHMYDWKSGYCFQKILSKAQPGSIDSEAGIFALCFDQSASRLISAEADKTIKMYKEDETATEETHPLQWRPELSKKKTY